jgi:hypothetical protein
MKRRCAKCKKNLNLAQFKLDKDGYHQSYCSFCVRKYRQAHYQKNRKKYIASAAARRKRVYAMVEEAKKVPCADCGNIYPPWVMDFDHVQGNKVLNVSRLKNYCSIKAIQEEISKCEVVCSNCHRQRTHDRKNCRVR